MPRIPLFILLLTAILTAALLLAQQPPTPVSQEPQMSDEDRARKNPIKSTKDSIEVGKKLFDSQCTMCHGEKGDGKGDLAVERGWQVVDFTDAKAMKEHSDAELFFCLTKGRAHMPGQENRLKDEQKWHIVNFIRSLAAPVNEKSPQKSEKPASQPRE